jgi:bifunctional non-homologous end joining protein LigD
VQIFEASLAGSPACPGLLKRRPMAPIGFTRLSDRYPLALAAVSALPARSCLIDNEIIVFNDDGLAAYDLLRARTHDHRAILCAFDLIELDGADLRSTAIEDRKQRLAWLLRSAHDGIAMNRHYDGDGAMVYKDACAFGCEGIVSKRRGSPYSAGRSSHWLRVKNPKAPAATRTAFSMIQNCGKI